MRGLVRRGAGAALCALLAGCGGSADEAANETSANEVAQQLAQISIEPGLWERSTEVLSVSAAGLPQEVASRAKGPRAGGRNCISAEQAARPNASFLATRQNSSCAYRDFVMQGGRISGTMVCSGGPNDPETRTAMTGEYGPRAYDMRMRIEASMPDGRPITTEVRVRGRRVGDCEQGSG